MKSLNKATLIGNVGHSIEAKYSQGGTCIVSSTLATNYKKKTPDGNYEDATTWHRFVAFGKSAEIMAEYVQKGDTLYIEGRINNETYEGRDGTKKNKSEIVVNEFLMLGKRQPKGPQEQAPQDARQASKDLANELRDKGFEPDQEIPF